TAMTTAIVLLMAHPNPARGPRLRGAAPGLIPVARSQARHARRGVRGPLPALAAELPGRRWFRQPPPGTAARPCGQRLRRRPQTAPAGSCPRIAPRGRYPRVWFPTDTPPAAALPRGAPPPGPAATEPAARWHKTGDQDTGTGPGTAKPSATRMTGLRVTC